MKKLFQALLLLSASFCQASTVTFSWTNWDGTVSTNDLVITYVKQPNSGDGRTAIKGLPRRYPTVNGNFQTNFAVGFYSVIPYDMDDEIQPILFEVPNDSQTYNFWSLRRSFGNYFDVTGVLGLTAGQGITLSPTNGVGFVTVTSAGGASNVFVNAGSNGVTVATNLSQSLFTVGLAFLPMVPSLNLTNWASFSTNYFYPSNNPSGFMRTNEILALFSYQTNAITTNNPTGMTNVVGSIASTAVSLSGLRDVGLGGLGANQALRYNSLSGKWTNDAAGAVSSVSVSVPAEFTVTGVPITGAGTAAISKANQSANTVWAGPTSGSPGSPSFRALVSADIPAVSALTYASNVLSGGQLIQSAIASNANFNGEHLVNSNGVTLWSANGGGLTNLQSTALIGLVPVASIGSGSGSAGTFLRGDRVWTSQLVGTLSVFGQINNTGNLLLDNGAIVSDGNGTVLALKWIGSHYGNGFGLTNVSATNLIDTVADARLSGNIPRLSFFNEWSNQNQFDQPVQFNNGITDIGALDIFKAVVVGTTVIGSSNKLQVVNAQGKSTLESLTNGVLWIGTNHQFTINFNGGVESYSGTNYFGGTIINSNTFTGNKVVSYDHVGNGFNLTNLTFGSISNITNSAASQKFLVGSSANSAQWVSVSGTSPLAITQPAADSYAWSINPGTFDNFAGGGGSLTNLNANSITGILKLVNFPALGAVYPAAITNNDTRSPVFSGSGLTALNASQLTSGTVPNARFPALGSVYGDALTNNETRTPKFTAGLTSVGTTSLGAVTITNASAATTIFNLGVTAAGVVTTNVSAIGIASSGTDSSAWHNGGDTYSGSTPSPFIGPTNQTGEFYVMMKENGVTSPVMQWSTAGGGENVSVNFGSSNNFVSSVNFNCTLGGGAHNTIAPAQTGAQIYGGQRNSISAGGGSNFGATVLGGATNVAAGNCSYAFGQAMQSLNDNSFGFNGIANHIVATSGGGGDNGKVIFASSNAGLEHTNSALGRFLSFGNSVFSTNTSEANAGTFGWTNAAGGFALLWNTTNPPSAGKANKVINGSLGGSNAVVLGTQVLPQAFQIKTNGDVRMEGNATILGTLTTTGFSPGAGSVTFSSLVVPYSTNLASHFADVGNSTTSDTTLYTDTLPASTLSANGQKVYAQYSLNTVSHATATRQIKVFFAGTSILDTGALVFPSVAGNVDIEIKIIRDSSTSIRYDSRATITGSNPTNFVTVGKLTGLTLSSAATIELHGQAGAAGAASSDIVATMGNVDWKP